MVSQSNNVPHPLTPITIDEVSIARQVIVDKHPGSVIEFRIIALEEPKKAALIEFLDLEHAGKLDSTSPRPPRLAKVYYDSIDGSKVPKYQEAIVDLEKREIVDHQLISTEFHASLTFPEFDTFVKVCKASEVFQNRIKEFHLPPGFEVVIEPWPYGGLDAADENRRFFQGLIYAADASKGNADTNFYAFPLPIIPVMDYAKREIIRIDELATGGGDDPLTGKTHAHGVIDHCRSSEYAPELLEQKLRTDLKALNVTQPDGPSFTVSDGHLVEWQKWRFRVSFNPREGAVLHDIHYDGRSVIHRLSFSEMSVPYADPRPPFHRKQAFDFGDGGLGHCTNNLQLGCDCLGVIKYLDGVIVNTDGTGVVAPNVICIHEQDNGINWKHTNWRTGRAVVSRRRELVVQFVITLANYEYVFAFKFDQAGAVAVETRATGIVSVVNIDEGKSAPWGTVVSPGALAQNHQHVFCVRIDPAIDGHDNTVVRQESHPMLIDARTNPHGNRYEVRETAITSASGHDIDPLAGRLFKIQNRAVRNPVSGRPVGYKIVPPATQKLLAAEHSLQNNRARFAQHHLWVTRHRDGEFYAAGRYTLQSRHERGGLEDMVRRGDDTLQQDVVVWSCFTLTHNPRVEDWPVMPVEIHQINITPADFFTANPALDVPSSKNLTSTLANGESNGHTNGNSNGNGSCCH